MTTTASDLAHADRERTDHALDVLHRQMSQGTHIVSAFRDEVRLLVEGTQLLAELADQDDGHHLPTTYQEHIHGKRCGQCWQAWPCPTSRARVWLANFGRTVLPI